MSQSNYERMLQIAEEVFSVKNDPDQLDVNEEVIEHLLKIHPATVSEFDDGNGPAAWILVIPTTSELMERFLSKNISEKQLFELTPLHSTYNVVYLCSAMVLPEYRNKGIATRYTVDAIKSILQNHPIKALFVWPFNQNGDATAIGVSKQVNLPLFKRNH